MKRLIAGVLAATLAWSASAQTPDELEVALGVLRDRVTFVDRSTAARLISAGGFTMLLSGLQFILGGMVVDRPWRLGLPRTNFSRLFIGLPVLVFTGGTIAVAIGDHLRRRDGPRRPREVAYYQSVEGLNEFMGLSTEEQRRLAVDNPEFAKFLIEIADAYRFAVRYRFNPDGAPNVRGPR